MYPVLGSGLTVAGGPSSLLSGGQTISVQPSQSGGVAYNQPGNPGGGYRYRPIVRPTDISFTELSALINVAAAVQTPIELGDVFDLIDGSATAIAFNQILCFTPNGRAVDLAVLTRTKLGGNWIGSQMIMIPAGTWQFVNVSGGAITLKELWAQHYDVTN